MKNKISLIAAFLMLWGTFYTNGQDIASFSLQQSIDYALENRASLQATRNEQRIAKAQVGEIRAAGLPQLNSSVEVGDNFIQQQSFLPAADPFQRLPPPGWCLHLPGI